MWTRALTQPPLSPLVPVNVRHGVCGARPVCQGVCRFKRAPHTRCVSMRGEGVRACLQGVRAREVCLSVCRHLIPASQHAHTSEPWNRTQHTQHGCTAHPTVSSRLLIVGQTDVLINSFSPWKSYRNKIRLAIAFALAKVAT